MALTVNIYPYTKFDYIINNPTGSINYLIEEVKKIMIKEGIINV